MKVINIQPAEKQTVLPHIELHSLFYTIQGEGPFCGQPAIFIRLAGCNLQCPGCDTEYSKQRTLIAPAHLVARVHELRKCSVGKDFFPLVVITGGEPFRQTALAELVRRLCSQGYRVQIETNGTLYVPELPWGSITVVCSPKTGKINAHLLPRIDAFKYVLNADSMCPDDGLPTLALGHSAAPRVARPPEGNTKPVYLQPMDCQSNEHNWSNLQACVESCMKHGYTLQLQIHKLIDME